MTYLGLSSSLFSLLFVLLVAITVAVVMWAVQIVAEERRSPAGHGVDRDRRGSGR